MKLRNLSRNTIVTLLGCITLTGCGNNNQMMNVSLEDVIEDNNKITNIDEILSKDENIVVNHNGNNETMILKDAVNYLEKSIYMVKKIEEIDAVKNKELIRDVNDYTKKQLEQLSTHDIALSVKEYYDEKTPYSNKRIIEQNLNYLNTYYKFWIKENGIKVSTELLSRVVSGEVCYLTDHEYTECVYNNDFKGDKMFPTATITLKDNNEQTYTVTTRSGVMYDAVKQLDNLKMKKDRYDLSYEEVEQEVIKSFNIAKLNIASNLYSKNGKLKVKESKNKIKEKYIIK